MGTDRRRDGDVWAVVVSGGRGERFGVPKHRVDLAGRWVLDWSVARAAEACDGVVVVVPEGEVDDLAARYASGSAGRACRVVAGGSTRSGSVRCGLAAVPETARVVVVHDGARPAASAALWRRVVDTVRSGAPAVVPVVPVTDSLRRAGGRAVDRGEFVAVQTPQGFDAAQLRAAHRPGRDASDDATLVEDAGCEVVQVRGEVANRKLTFPGDDVVLAGLLSDAPPAGESS